MLFYEKTEKQKKIRSVDEAPLQKQYVKINFPNRKKTKIFHKRVSCCASGSLTVEAAIIIPLFFYTFVILISLMDLYRNHVLITTALQDTAKELGIYACTQEKETLLLEGISLLHAEKKIPDHVKKTGKILWIGSGYRQKYINLKGSYEWKPPIAFFGIRKFRIAVCGRVRGWSGRDLSEENYQDQTETQNMVYITEYGEVYHTCADCTYLDLTIIRTDSRKVKKLRNKSGGKYYPCEKCSFSYGPGEIYVTQYGDRYHSNGSCSSLKRKVRMVPEKEVKGKSLCSRCAKQISRRETGCRY